MLPIKCPLCFKQNQIEAKQSTIPHVCSHCGALFHVGWILVANTNVESLKESLKVGELAINERDQRLNPASKIPS